MSKLFIAAVLVSGTAGIAYFHREDRRENACAEIAKSMGSLRSISAADAAVANAASERHGCPYRFQAAP